MFNTPTFVGIYHRLLLSPAKNKTENCSHYLGRCPPSCWGTSGRLDLFFNEIRGKVFVYYIISTHFSGSAPSDLCDLPLLLGERLLIKYFVQKAISFIPISNTKIFGFCDVQFICTMDTILD